MSEFFRGNEDSAEKSEGNLSREEVVALGNEVCERGEIFPFPGVESVAEAKMKAVDEAYPGFTTPTDKILERLTKEGMKLVPQSKGNGQFFILPAESNNIEDDSIPPEYLVVNDAMNEDLKRFILSLK